MSDIRIVPATDVTFTDVESVMTGGGDGGSCWCQWFMVRAKDWNDSTREERHDLLRDELHAAGDPAPALVAYVDGEPAGWVRVSPRVAQPRLAFTKNVQASPLPQDDPGIWAVTCFVVRREHRRSGLSAQLLEAAVSYARTHGAHVIEGYPVDRDVKKASSNELFHGSASTFLAAGFVEVARPTPSRPILSLPA